MIGKLKTLLNIKKPKQVQKTLDEKITDLFESLQVDALAVSFGDDILPFAQNIVNCIGKFRVAMKEKSGFIIPPVRVINDKDCQENEIQILVRGHVVFQDFALPTKDYVLETILNNLAKISTKNISDIFTNEMTEKYIDLVQKNNSWLIWNVMRIVPVTGIKLILVDILKAGKSIKDIVFVFEKICEYASENKDFMSTKDPSKIAECIKKDLV